MTDDAHAGSSRRRPLRRQDDFTIERDPGAQVGVSPNGHSRAAGSASADDRDRPDADRRQDGLPYPPRVTRKYYLVPGPEERSAARQAYADARGEYLVFKDEGTRLATRREEAEVVRDLVAIAQHREWQALRVTGSVGFRREVWLEATARGLMVDGYSPTDLDRQALDKRRDHGAASERRSRGGTPQAAGADGADRLRPAPPALRIPPERSGTPQKPDGRTRKEPMVRDNRAVGGRRFDVDAGPNKAEPGQDRMLSGEGERTGSIPRRTGRNEHHGPAEAGGSRSDKPVGARGAGTEATWSGTHVVEGQDAAQALQRQTRIAPWTSERDRLRTLPRDEAVKDPNLAAAHSHLIVLDRALRRVFPSDAAAREAVLSLAQDRLGFHLAQGRAIRRAEYATPVREKALEGNAPEQSQREAQRYGLRRRGVREHDR